MVNSILAPNWCWTSRLHSQNFGVRTVSGSEKKPGRENGTGAMAFCNCASVAPLLNSCWNTVADACAMAGADPAPLASTSPKLRNGVNTLGAFPAIVPAKKDG